MRVVVDTNVLVSAALRDRKPERVVLFVAEQPDVEWVASREILSEYGGGLARPRFGLTPRILVRWRRLLASATTLVEVPNDVEFLRDRKDAKFLACALAADADFFVTGDRDFEHAQRLVRTTILSVTLFEKLVCGTRGRR